MERNYAMQLFSALKTTIFIGSIMYGCSANAQSIIGKWKLSTAKETVTDPSGHKQHLSAQMGDITKTMEQVIEFRANNTYFMQNKMINAKSGIEVNGTYSITGNQLKLQRGKSNMPGVKSSLPVNNTLPAEATIVSVNTGTLILRYGATTIDDGKNFTVDIIDTFTKQ